MENKLRPPSFIRRYTDLPSALHILTTRSLTLLDPATWDDKNDSFFMSLYQQRKGFRTVLALCFSLADETYHHWRIFSSGPSGVCIVFDRSKLLESLGKVSGVTSGRMNYLTIKNAKSTRFTVEELPFLKRHGYKPEDELRALFASVSESRFALDVPIDLADIRRISLSPWMHSRLSKSTVAAIRAINGCEKMRVSRSTLISNEQWKMLGQRAE